MFRRRLIVAVVAVMAAVATVAITKRGGDPPAPTLLAEREVEAGEVTVKVRPVRIDDEGAEFRVVFDTHSVDLGFDVAGNAQLTVGGSAWTDPSWEGAAPGGHHREGTLRFRSGGSATGEVELRLAGLPVPVTATWAIPGR